MPSISAVNTFRLRAGVTPEQFARFSAQLDRPTCLGLGPVEAFDVYLAEAGSTVDVVEVMTVTSWPEWEQVRDNAPEMEPVVARFEELVDVDSVTTYLTRRA